jgi:hypothetical protein
MKETQEMKEHSSGRRLDLLLLAILFGLGFGVRLLYSRAVVFPPLDDPAFYLTTATNLISGRGLVVDVLWSYHGSPMNVTHRCRLCRRQTFVAGSPNAWSDPWKSPGALYIRAWPAGSSGR